MTLFYDVQSRFSNNSYFAAYGLMSLVGVQAQKKEWTDLSIFLWLCLCVAIVSIQKLAYVPCWSIYVQSLVLCLEDVQYTRTVSVVHKY